MSTDTNSESQTYNTLESLHDLVHFETGGNGHMAIIPWAAFDPIFWLHHA